jgi:hypothetical protein
MQKRSFSKLLSLEEMGDTCTSAGELKLRTKRTKIWSAADYVKLLNINTAKTVAVILVICFATFHGILHMLYGVTPCKGLLEDGMYKEGGDGLWQPWGCMMHQYSQTLVDSPLLFVLM